MGRVWESKAAQSRAAEKQSEWKRALEREGQGPEVNLQSRLHNSPLRHAQQCALLNPLMSPKPIKLSGKLNHHTVTGKLVFLAQLK